MSGAQTHELQLKINAAAAETGAKRFKSAIASIKRSVEGLERSTDGSFKSLQKSLNIPAAGGSTEKALRGQATAAKTAETASTRLATATTNAMTTATGQAAKLRTQFEAMGDTAGIDRVNAALAKLQASAKAAGSSADLGAAKADYRAQIAGLQDTAKAQKLAALGAQNHAAELVALKTKYDPIFAASKLYEKQLGEVNAAHKAGVLSADQHENAIDHLNTQLQMGTVSSNKYAQSVRVSSMHMSGYTANIVSQFNDIGVMLASGQSPFILAMQQGTQLSQVLNQMGGKGGVLAALKSGFMTMINPISILTIGSIALGAALVQAFTKAMPKTVSFKEAIEDAGTAIREAASAAGEVRDFSTMVQAYGGATLAVRELIAAKAELARVTALEALDASKAGLASDDLWTRLANSLRGYSADAKGQIRRIGDELDLTKVQATALNSALTAAINTEDPAEYADALRGVRGQLTAAAGGVENMTGKQRAFYEMLVESEDKARQMAALNMEKPFTLAQIATTEWGDRMQGVLTTINAIKSSLSSIGGGVLSNAAKEAELRALSEGKSIQDAANAATRFKKETEWNARAMGANWFGRQVIEMERAQFERGLALDSQLDAARSASRTSGGGRAQLTSSVETTIAALEKENMALEAQRLGIVTSDTAARMYAETILANGGNIDAATLATIKHADSLAILNEQLQQTTTESSAAGDGLASMGKTVNSSLERGIADAFKGGSTTSILTSFADTLRNSVADSLAKSVVAKLGLDSLFNIGGTTAAAQMQAGIITGGNIAAQTMATAISTGQATPAAVATSGGGGGGNWLSTAVNFATSLLPMFKEGGISDAPDPFANAPHYAEGTANTSNGIPSILHPNEAVVPLSRGRKIPVDMGSAGGENSVVINGGINTEVKVEGDASADDAAKIAQAVGETVDGRIRSIMAEEMAYGGIANPRGGR